MKKFSILIFVVAFLASGVFAQPKGKDFYKRFEMIRLWLLTDELNLTEAQATKVFPIIKKYNEKKKGLFQQRNQLVNDFREKFKKGKITEEDIGQLLKSWEEIRIKGIRIDKEEFKELSSVLSKEQQARYLLFKMRFPHEIRKILKQMRQRKALRGNR